jgi:hypothetical protein
MLPAINRLIAAVHDLGAKNHDLPGYALRREFVRLLSQPVKEVDMNRVLSRSVIALPLLCSMNVTAAAAQAQAEHQAKALTLPGNVALWTMAIKPDKTADFEVIMAKLRDGLSKSTKPERRQQAAGWRLMRVGTPLPDGTIAYVHIINPVVPGADYTIMQALYDEFPDERQALYDMYRAAFAKSLSLASGSVVLDLSSTAPATASPASPAAPATAPEPGAPSPAR